MMVDKKDPIGDLNYEFQYAFKEFAHYVVEDRAIPSLYDGFKPVQRRIMYSLLKDFDSSKFHSSARVSGSVNGRYHPHSDESTYLSIIRMCQPFTNASPFVSIQGNCGSLDGDGPASKRYTAVRISKKWEKFFKEFLDVSSFVPNYDITLTEPDLLFNLIPSALLNFTQGIAVGFMTATLPFNLGEVYDGLIAAVKNENLSLDELLEIVPGPDFVLGGIVLNTTEDLKKIFQQGKGSIIYASKFEILPKKTPTITITSIPPGASKSQLLLELGSNLEKLPEIVEVYDESEPGKVSIRIVLKDECKGQEVIVVRKIFKHTGFQTRVPYASLFLDKDKRPKVFPLLDIFKELVAHFKSIIFLKSQSIKQSLESQIHIYRGMQIVLTDLERFIKFVRNNNKEEIFNFVVEEYGLDKAQFDALMALKISQLTKLEKENLTKTIENLLEKREFHCEILENPARLSEYLIEKFIELKHIFKIDRKTSFSPDFNSKKMIDFISRQEGLGLLTSEGFFHFEPVDFDSLQKRGGLGKTIQTASSINQAFPISSHDSVFFTSNFGRAYYQEFCNLYPFERNSEILEVHLLEAFDLEPGEVMTSVVKIPQPVPMDSDIVLVSNFGNVKKITLSSVLSSRRRGVGISLCEGEEIIYSEVVTPEHVELLLATQSGRVLRTSLNEFVSVTSRTTSGVIGYPARGDEKVVSAKLLDSNVETFFITLSGGNCRQIPQSLIPVYKRNTRGVKLLNNLELLSISGLNPSISNCRILFSSGRNISFSLEDVGISNTRIGKGVFYMQNAPSNETLFSFFY